MSNFKCQISKRLPIRNWKLEIGNSAGFTLIELLVVIAIIAILASLLMSNFIGIRQRARDAQRKSDLQAIRSALEYYRADIGAYPATASFPTCGSPLTGTVSGNTVTYIQKVPCDPTSASGYQYTLTGTSYTLRACLENLNDANKDATNNAFCTGGTTNISYTLQNL